MDYKRGDALRRQSDQRDGLMKEVLAFANSGGGTLVYVVATFAERARKHCRRGWLPCGSDGNRRVDPANDQRQLSATHQ